MEDWDYHIFFPKLKSALFFPEILYIIFLNDTICPKVLKFFKNEYSLLRNIDFRGLQETNTTREKSCNDYIREEIKLDDGHMKSITLISDQEFIEEDEIDGCLNKEKDGSFTIKYTDFTNKLSDEEQNKKTLFFENDESKRVYTNDDNKKAVCWNNKENLDKQLEASSKSEITLKADDNGVLHEINRKKLAMNDEIIIEISEDHTDGICNSPSKSILKIPDVSNKLMFSNLHNSIIDKSFVVFSRFGEKKGNLDVESPGTELIFLGSSPSDAYYVDDTKYRKSLSGRNRQHYLERISREKPVISLQNKASKKTKQQLNRDYCKAYREKQ